MRRLARPALGIAFVGALAAVSVLAVRGYLTPETMLYLASFRWCF